MTFHLIGNEIQTENSATVGTVSLEEGKYKTEVIEHLEGGEYDASKIAELNTLFLPYTTSKASMECLYKKSMTKERLINLIKEAISILEIDNEYGGTI